MSTRYTRFLREQIPVIQTIGRAVVPRRRRKTKPSFPAPPVHRVVPPRSEGLVAAYIEHLAIPAERYPERLPSHFFPQYAFPALMQTLEGVPYPMMRVVNGGCKLVQHGPVPSGQPLILNAQLGNIDDNGRRAVLQQELTVGTEADAKLLEATVYAIVPLPKKKGAPKGPKKEKVCVPEDATLATRWSLTPQDAADFACLTGDVNPIHWSRMWAKLSGFPATILHGFATLARALEGLIETQHGGDPNLWREVDVQFKRPLALPADVGLYLGPEPGSFFVGDAPGAPAYLAGHYTTQETTDDV
jgi:acyl dehydratase